MDVIVFVAAVLLAFVLGVACALVLVYRGMRRRWPMLVQIMRDAGAAELRERRERSRSRYHRFGW